jgi:hypothetical protein
MLDVLLEELLALNSRLEDAGVPVILGGGMGLYLRDRFLGGVRSPRYPLRPESRSTEDLDVLLNADVVVDADRMNGLRDVLDKMGYDELVPYFQFERSLEMAGTPRTVQVDLLAAPPDEAELDKVKIKRPRVRPQDSEDIHGYLTDEAAGIDIGKISIDLSSEIESGDARGSVVHIPSSFNYLILKLNAFHDRRDRTDPESDRGRHHAFDIFRIVTDMREDDWQTAENHVALDGEADYVRNAATLQRRHFSDDTSAGVIRLMENEGYRRHRDEFDGYIDDFLIDLCELFADVTA